jgi:hypothetical protein
MDEIINVCVMSRNVACDKVSDLTQELLRFIVHYYSPQGRSGTFGNSISVPAPTSALNPPHPAQHTAVIRVAKTR